jgi:hypothetical protein
MTTRREYVTLTSEVEGSEPETTLRRLTHHLWMSLAHELKGSHDQVGQ